MIESSEFTDKAVYITGAATGIGRATAVAFADAGAQVAIADIDAEGAEETRRLIEQRGGRAISVHVDVTDESAVIEALRTVEEAFGGLDIAVNNAGAEQPDQPTAEVSTDMWDHIIDTNLRSAFLAIRHQVPMLQRRGGGVIVNVSSGAGVIGIKNQAAYSAAKHGLIGLTRSVALDYANTGIRVNVVAPGIIETSMMGRVFGEGEEGRENASAAEPIGRPGRPEEIASAVLWMSSEKAAFLIGHALVMDGGQTIQ
jgi:NAD(P)-dependent dehydrogenase (short-subunit alcohol dehydrogenase family)